MYIKKVVAINKGHIARGESKNEIRVEKVACRGVVNISDANVAARVVF